MRWQEPKNVAVLVILLIFLIIFAGQVITNLPYKLSITLVLSCLILIVILINTDAGLAILIFSMLFSPEILLGRVPGRDIVIRFDDLLLAAITFGWLAKTSINKGLALFVKTPLNKAIGVYIMVCLISTLRGIILGYVGPAKGSFYILRYTEYFLLFILVVNHIHSKKQIKSFLAAFFITCGLVSVYGILQIPTGVRVSAPFEGEVGEPNTFGGYLLFLFCLAIGIFLQYAPQRKKLYLLGLAALMFFPFLYTLSRASYLGIIFSFVTFIVLAKRKFLLVTMITAIILAGIVLRPEAVFSRVKDTFQERQANLAKIGNIYLDASSSERILSWKDALEAWTKNPILGRGVTGFGFLDGQYILTLPELGLIGLFSFLWLLWTIFKNSLLVYKKTEDEFYKGLTLGFIAGFIGLTIHALTANTFIIIRIMEPFWFVAGMVIAIPQLKEIEKTTFPEKRE